MKIKTTFLSALLLGAVMSCSKQTQITDQFKNDPQKNSKLATQADTPLTWQEHWFEHNQLLNRVFSDTSVAVYYDNDVDRSITWPYTYLAQVWNYTKKTYGSFGAETRLYVILHTAKYSGGHPSTYMDGSHDYRNVIDCGSNSTTAWTAGTGNDLDLTTHEVGHIVEGASKNVHNSPAFGIWHDSKWMEMYIYDVYLGLGRTSDAQRWYNLVLNNSDTYPRANTHWFKDWFYPLYTQYGKTAVLNKYFTLLAANFPKHTVSNGVTNISEYTRGMNFGEFVHFWSGAAGADLKQLALTAFGNKDEQGNDWTVQLEQAKATFPNVTYPGSTPTTVTLTVSKENSGGPGAAEGSLKMIDGNLTSKFFVAGYDTGFWAQLTYPSAVVLKGYALTSGNDAPDRDPKSWKLMGSNDGSNFTQLDVRTNESFPSRNQTKSYTFTNSTAYKYYRLYITANNGSPDFQLSEWAVSQ
ncbi:discoidin domain-containing protein [Mucilaginibacter sp. HC2]|uniref:discoidin domain-containing protein n=1 Tax=Mucilaginibacter inviolabilis TaxID=2714892 RepID=UPI0014098882|nr:discoidin domain-containing protein [Mucilaginibacter inviolabilis]NHA06493.1 discoidin domain-containing protein [Mucilaginibacter inviolabilis]